ncbi:MAG: type 1 glutamine amidotransferase [Nitrososphaera sp.]
MADFLLPVLVVDNLSPFTPDITKCLSGLGVEYRCEKYSHVTKQTLGECGKVILSGRRRNSKEINAANSRIVRYCLENDKPLLGICYGAEILALTLGGSLRRMPSHLHGHVKVFPRHSTPLTQDRKVVIVYESHGYCIAKLPTDFVSLAGSKDCEHELFSHVAKKIYGVQFHPEKSGSDGIAILKSFTSL